jgi:hypothetical protein
LSPSLAPLAPLSSLAPYTVSPSSCEVSLAAARTGVFASVPVRYGKVVVITVGFSCQEWSY